MLRLRCLLALIIGCTVVSLTIGAGATASVARGTLAISVLNADIEQPGPPDCDGMAFVRTIVGTPANDVIRVTDVPTLVFGLGGRDVILGGRAQDCLVGGAGSDFVTGGGDDDVVVGGNGDDRLGGGRGSDRIYGGPGKDRLFDAELARDDDDDEDADDRGGADRVTAWQERDRGRNQDDGSDADASPDLLDGGAQRDRCFGSRLDTFRACERIFLVRPDRDDAVLVDPSARRDPPTPVDETPAPTDGGAATDPTSVPTTPAPTSDPTTEPTLDPTAAPTTPPTPEPTPGSTPDPTPEPTPDPTLEPTPEPSPDPTGDPTSDPTASPS